MKFREFIYGDKWYNLFIILFVFAIIANYFLDNFIPLDLKSINIFGFEMVPGTFQSVSVFFWVLSFKIEVIALCSLWFLTCRHWWRFVILIPFVIEIYKLIGLFDTSTTVIDETNYISSLPVTLPVIILVLFVLRRDYQIRIQNKILLDLDSEINLMLIASTNQTKLKKMEAQFNELLNRKSFLSKEEYINQLNALQLKMRSI